MSKFICVLLFIVPLCSYAQSHPIKALNRYGNVVKEDFVYIQTDRPFYEPYEMVCLSFFVVDNQTKKFSKQSSGISVEVFDPAGSKLKSIHLPLEQQQIYFEFRLGKSGGFYKVRVKTPYNSFIDSNAYFEKEIQVQDIKYTQVLMDLELDKMAYNRGDELGVKGLIKNRDGTLMRNVEMNVSLWINGVEDVAASLRTDKEGQFNTKLKIKDTAGIYMMAVSAKLDYAGIPISRFKHVPFNSGMLNVQFLPEGGWMLQGVESRVAFQCKDVFGKPADIKGAIYDSTGLKITDFESAYGGMGVFSFKPIAGQKYIARIKRIGEEDLIVELPEALVSGTVIKGIEVSKKELNIKLESTTARALHVVLRRGDSVVNVKKLEAVSIGEVKFDLVDAQMGMHEVAVFDEAWNIKCTRRVFLRPDKKLNIHMTFSGKVYSVGQIATCKVKITDEEGKPVQTNFVLSVYNEQIKQYAEDNRENILSSMYLASELEEEVHQPAYYFKDLDSARLSHLDLLMMTHGWRRIQWQFAADANNEKMVKANGYRGDPRVLSANFTLAHHYRSYGNVFNPKKARLICLNNGQEVPVNENGFTLWGINHNEELKFKLIYKNRFVYRFSEKSIAVQSLEPYRLKGIKYKEIETLNTDTGLGLGFNSIKTNGDGPKLILQANSTEQVLEKNNLNLNLGKNEKIRKKNESNEQKDQVIEFENVKVTSRLSPSMTTMFCGYTRSYEGYWDNGSRRYDRYFLNVMQHHVNTSMEQALYPQSYFNNEHNIEGNLVYYNSTKRTDVFGNCDFDFYLPNESTSCFAFIEGLSQAGNMGIAEGSFSVKKPVSVLFNVPEKLVVDDQLKLPLIITSNLKSNLNLHVDIIRNFKNQLTDKLLDTNMVIGSDAKVSFMVPLSVRTTGYHTLHLNVNVNGSSQYLKYEILVEPKGKPQTVVLSSNQPEYRKSFLVNGEVMGKEITLNVSIQKSMLQMFKENSENIIRQPSGCFEQVSSSNYPNIIAYQLLRQLNGETFQENKTQLESILRSGYSKLAAYETKQGGFEWYGNTPPHEGLTAYGLLQFHELKQTGLSVDEKLEKRTIKWLLSRFKSDGSINVNAGKYGFSGAGELVTTAYVTYVLSVISDMDLNNQIQYIVKNNSDQSDAYINALLAGIYLNRNNVERAKLLLDINFNQLIKNKFESINASPSIVRSGGKTLVLEVMGLTAYFAYQAKALQDKRILTVMKMFENQNQYGFFGNTQSNVWIMKTISEWLKVDKPYSESGSSYESLIFKININGHEHEVSKELKEKNVYSFQLPADMLKVGENTIEVYVKGLNDRLYAINLEYEINQKNTYNGPLKLMNECVNRQVKSAGVIQFNYQLTNTQKTGLPQTVIVIPLSSGVDVSPDQLRAMHDMNQCDYYEIKNNMLILYYAELGPGEIRDVPLTFKVLCNGTFTMPEPRAYIYYQPELCAFGVSQTIQVID